MLRVQARLINTRINRNIIGNARVVKAMRAVSNKQYHDQVTEERFPQIGNSSLVENIPDPMDTVAAIQKAKNIPSAKFFDSKILAKTREDLSQEANKKVSQEVNLSQEVNKKVSQEVSQISSRGRGPGSR